MFQELYGLHQHGREVIEANMQQFQKPVDLYLTTRRHIADDGTQHNHRFSDPQVSGQ
jgi:hypothetical protein